MEPIAIETQDAYDDGVYEDVDTSKAWGPLDAIQEESDSDYYRSVDYCNMVFRNAKGDGTNAGVDGDVDDLMLNCERYLKDGDDRNVMTQVVDNTPKLYPKTSVCDRIYNFKKDFSNHDYANINFDDNHHDYENIEFPKKTKNDVLRERFFNSLNSNDKNNVNDRFNRSNDSKKIECHSIRNDVTKTGPDVKVSGSLNLKLLNLDRYNRVLTTTETFMQKAESSFTKNEIKKNNADLESFVKRSEKYYTEEARDRKTTVQLNNDKETPKGKTEIRIFYNPTFKSTGTRFLRGFCQFCNSRCPRSELKCCPKCVCLELEMKLIWKENWLNILLMLAMFFVLVALLVQCVLPKDVCEGQKGNATNERCFEMI